MIRKTFKADPLATLFVLKMLLTLAFWLLFLATCGVSAVPLATPCFFLLNASGLLTACAAVPSYPWSAVQAMRALSRRRYLTSAAYAALTLVAGAVIFVAALGITFITGIR